MVEIHCVITGNVQGVAYRTYAQESATFLDIVGYVENMPDGSVIVVGQARTDVLKEFVEYLNEGSLMSQVASVAIDWRSVTTTFDEFSVLH